jgi:hypothetical protein
VVGHNLHDYVQIREEAVQGSGGKETEERRQGDFFARQLASCRRSMEGQE